MGSLPRAAYWGIGLGIVAFFISFSTLSTSNINGQVSCSYMDFAAIVLGIVVGIIGLSLFRTPAYGGRSQLAIPAGVIIAALGVVHILRGIGVVMGPCNV
ncbi:MAG: hypothetical protein RLO50_11635 [Azospirillaceae bacterium]